MSAGVDLVLRPSARAHHLLFWLHVLPLALLPAAMASGPPMLLVAAAIGASWLWLRRHPAFGYGPRAIRRIQVSPEGRWSLQVGNRRVPEAELLASSVMTAPLLVLNFRVAGERRTWTRVLLGDEATDEPLRRLRARLHEGNAT